MILNSKITEMKMINLAISAMLSLLIASCTKEGVDKCRSNCAIIIISGQAWDSSYRKGMANIPVKVYWQDAGMCFICPENIIANSKTDANGRFYFNMSIDSSRFHGNGLHIAVTMPTGYISNGSVGYISNGSNGGNMDAAIYQYTSSVRNIRFHMYESAKLNIKLQRTQTDNYIGFDLNYRFDFTRFGIYGYFGPPPSAYTDFNVATAANVYTKVSWQKWLSPGVISTFVDSIKCVANSNNTITLNY
jgi:hypothetical protein